MPDDSKTVEIPTNSIMPDIGAYIIGVCGESGVAKLVLEAFKKETGKRVHITPLTQWIESKGACKCPVRK